MQSGTKDEIGGGPVSVGRPLDEGLQALDPFRLPGYLPPKAEEESVRTWLVSVAGIDAVWIDCQSARTGGTIGVVAGERIVRAYDSATALRRPVVVTMSGGGTRVEEGALALAQMTRVAAAMGRHRAARLITVAHFGSPVAVEGFASWVSLADVRAAEPGAQLGAHSSAERAHEEGLIDALVPRERRWHWMADVLGAQPSAILELPADRPSAPDTSAVPDDPHQQLLRCQAVSRPSGLEWAAWLTDGWIELRGRQSGVRAGVAWIAGHRVVVVATDRHAHPGSASAGIDGLRLAQRAARLADRWCLPVLTIVDAPPARWTSEEDGESGPVHTAHTLLALSEVRSRTVALVVGEAGSTGVAAALTNTDRLLMLDGSLFSTAESEHGTSGGPAHGTGARDLVELGVADRVITAGPVSAVRHVLVEELDGGDDSHARVDRLDFATERVVINMPVRGACGRGRPATNFPKSSPVVDGVGAS